MGKGKKAGNKSNAGNDAAKGGRHHHHHRGVSEAGGTTTTTTTTGGGTSQGTSGVTSGSSSLLSGSSTAFPGHHHHHHHKGGGTTTTSTAHSTLWAPLSPEAISNYQTSSVHWVVACVLLGLLLGYAMGAGWTELSGTVSPWRKSLGKAIRSSAAFQLMTFRPRKWEELASHLHSDLVKLVHTSEQRTADSRVLERNPSHPRTFALLREAVVREKGGYVHPDLGILSPAPCGSVRGLGMVDNSYHVCQIHCMPGTTSERWELYRLKLREDCDGRTCTNSELLPIYPNDADPLYEQEEILVKVPLSYQITRSVAVSTLTTLIPADAQTSANFAALDDAALLTLFLAHERGVGKYSKWYPYIVSLPHEPSCGYSRSLRPYMLDAIEAMRHELGIDVEGWNTELVKASMYADRIVKALAQDYGSYLKAPPHVSSSAENIRWALCQVASRATTGDRTRGGGGSLRMIPLLDLVNHDAHSEAFVELVGTEAIATRDFIDATSDDAGAFVLRSRRHGRKRPLRKGQEVLVNYNVPLYTPLDWFLSMGFVPPERWGPWEKVDLVLPRVRRDGPFSEEVLPHRTLWETDAATVLKKIREAERIWSSE